LINWILRHGATVLIFLGGGIAAFAAFVSERRASGQREQRRKGFWPMLILAGAIVGGVGALWGGYQQDRLFDYLSGGDSYGFLMPGPVTSKSIQFSLVERGDSPLYDVSIDMSDVTKWRKSWLDKGWPPQALDPNSNWSDTTGAIPIDQIMDLKRATSTSVFIGNVAPNTVRFAVEVPVPDSDDQRYGFSIWARNGLIHQQILMHRISSGWVAAWKVERTSPQVKDGKQWTEKLEEYTMPGFPSELVKWN
jgi:hypothetical protein